jgi:hypothetical protein
MKLVYIIYSTPITPSTEVHTPYWEGAIAEEDFCKEILGKLQVSYPTRYFWYEKHEVYSRLDQIDRLDKE